jgi:hypothetical protein
MISESTGLWESRVSFQSLDRMQIFFSRCYWYVQHKTDCLSIPLKLQLMRP